MAGRGKRNLDAVGEGQCLLTTKGRQIKASHFQGGWSLRSHDLLELLPSHKPPFEPGRGFVPSRGEGRGGARAMGEVEFLPPTRGGARGVEVVHEHKTVGGLNCR